jgi:hypothetical protein
MDCPNTPLMPDYTPSEEIRTKHKEAIRQLYKQAKFMPSYLAILYYVRESLINRVLRYDKPKQARLGYTGLAYKLNDM